MGCLEVAAEMGIMPSEFWGLTYAELAAFGRGHQRAKRNDAGTLAHFTAQLINLIPIPLIRKRRRFTGSELMGERRRSVQDVKEHR